MRTSLLAAATAVAGLLGAACADDGASDRTGPLALYPGEPNGDNALFVGPLSLEDGCLYLGGTVAGEPARWLVVFPARGTSWDSERQAVVRKGSKALVVGTTVSVGGSEGTPAAESRKWTIPPADSCESRRIWLAGDD